jgi:acetylornithine/succinyldiaminopimelate/putrescine aminotransferase
MVYGEFAQQPAVDLCKTIASLLPKPLDTTYLVNSGTEAIEASIKLARRATGRSEIIAMHNCYHGNTLGSLSLMNYEERKAPFRPLLPAIKHISFNCHPDLKKITKSTAAVIIETIQGGAGFIVPNPTWIKELEKQCRETDALLIVDEIQPGLGRTGKMFCFEHYGVIPDMVVSGKGLAGGLPIGSLTASHALMSTFKDNPMLGHITTFGGHPVIAASALATLKTIAESNYLENNLHLEQVFRTHLSHPLIQSVRGKGLMLAAILDPNIDTAAVVTECMKRGVLFFLLLFEKFAVRITPPYTVSENEVIHACAVLCDVLDHYSS